MKAFKGSIIGLIVVTAILLLSPWAGWAPTSPLRRLARQLRDRVVLDAARLRAEERAEAALARTAFEPPSRADVLNGSQGLGPIVPDLDFLDRDGQRLRLSGISGARGLLIAVSEDGCTLSGKYVPVLKRLTDEFQPMGFGILHLKLGSREPGAPRPTDGARDALPGHHGRDWGGLRRALGVRTTTEVFLLDAQRRLVYRGAIDDQFGIGINRPGAEHQYLRAALEATAAGRPVSVSGTHAPGCLLPADPERASLALSAGADHEIGHILRRSCQPCHRPGGSASFSLFTYDQVRERRRMIRFMVADRRMPPWDLTEGSGPWRDDVALRESERRRLVDWLDAGCPHGAEAADLDQARRTDDWQIGKPDFIVEVPQSIAIPATGLIPYQDVEVDPGLREDRWVQRIEIQSDVPEAMHHTVVMVELPGRGPSLPTAALDSYFAVGAPGTSPTDLPDGVARHLPAGSRFRFQIHYTATGVERHDRLRMGLVFSRRPPRRAAFTRGIYNEDIAIPAGDPHHEESATYVFERPATLFSFYPHMHYRGRAFRYDLYLPDGTHRELLNLRRYDFNWQRQYVLQQPLPVPAGSRLVLTGVYDNSAGNPANPDPNRTVSWGIESTDEMLLGFFEYSWDDGHGGAPLRTGRLL